METQVASRYRRQALSRFFFFNLLAALGMTSSADFRRVLRIWFFALLFGSFQIIYFSR